MRKYLLSLCLLIPLAAGTVPIAHNSNPGSAFERRYEINGSADTQRAQTMLDNIKLKIEGDKR